MALPSGYKRLEYIQSNGNQYINSNHYATQNTKVVADAEYLDGSNYPMVCGSYISGSNTFAIFFNSGWHAWFGSSSVIISGDFPGRKAFSLDKSSFKVGESTTAISSGNFTSTLPLYIFAMSQVNAVYYQATMRMYSLQIFESDVLVRDYIPCQTTDGDVGLWDNVNSVFYGNAGTGTFTAGPVVASPSIFVNIDGIWKPINHIYVNINNIWQKST